MTARELLAELDRRGIKVWADGGKLRYDAPKGALDDALRSQVVALRADLIQLLESSAVGMDTGQDADGPVSVPRDREMPLSYGQQRLWFLNHLSPDDRAYNVPATVRLRGELDVDLLRRGIDEMYRRHETLRSRMPDENGKARLIIEPPGRAPFTLHIMDDATPEERLASATRLARETAVRPIDLGAGPLFQVFLFRVSADDHILLVLMHHIISDGWSMGVFFRGLSALYNAFLEGEESPLEELPIQYADFAYWQQEAAGKARIDKSIAWWKQQLGGELPVFELPTDRPRPTVPLHRGASLWFPIDLELRDGLLRLAQAEGATRFQLLLAAFYVLLNRHTGQEDIVLGTPVAGRSRREIEQLIGFFVNNLVLRGDLGGDPTFRELLKRVRGLVLESFAHQDAPFEKIVDALSPERELGRNPLFQVLFNHFASEFAFTFPPLELSTVDMTLDVSKFDLTLHCFERGDLLIAKFEYDTALFDKETVQAMGERYVTLLRGIVAAPSARLSKLPVLSDVERRTLLVDWNRVESAQPEAQSVHELFLAQAARTPDAPALVFEQQRFTYAELHRRSNALAQRLAALGVGPDERVALYLDRSAELIIGLLGILEANGAYVPIDGSTPPERVEYLLRDAGCRAVVTHSLLAPNLPDDAPPSVLIDQLGELDPAAPPSTLPPGRPGQLAYVIYTSGSTGEPKGVEVEHAQLLDYIAGIRPRLDVPADCRFATVSTLAADLGNTTIFPALCGGGCLHVMSDERIGDGDAFAAAMAGEAIDVLKIVPSHLEALLTAAQQPTDVLPARLLVLGGEACSWALVERVQQLAPDCAIMNHYGPAETTVGVATHRIAPGDRETYPAAPPLGRPLPNTQFYLVDRHLEPVPTGAVGELLVGGGGVTRGYLGRPDLTQERFIPDPFRRGSRGRVYRTGDLARYTHDGQLLFMGRGDDQVKVRGYRVELGEVAAALERHPAIQSAAALVRKDRLGVARLVAYVVPGPDGMPDTEALRSQLKATLPDYMVPTVLQPLDALPLNANGKLDRRALPEPEELGVPRTGTYVAPRTPAEQALADIWCDVLHLDRVGVHDNFFELGGESILSIQIISRANQAGLRLKPRDVFDRGTIAELAIVAREAEEHSAEQGPVTGPVPLTPVQHRFFDQSPAEPWHYNHALMLCSRQSLETDVLERALIALENHHDVLRLRFRRAAGNWRQELTAPRDEVAFGVQDLGGLTPDQQRERMKARAAELQAGLDLEQGPLWQAELFRMGGAEDDRLLIVIHHLAVDGVSWRLLLEDLALACEQLSAGQPVALPPKTSSFKTWAETLTALAAQPSVLDGAGYWLTDGHRDATSLPVDLPAGESPDEDARTAARAATLEVVLDSEETERLLRDVPSAYHTRINDLLLTALAQACEPWTGSRQLLVDLEGHGRQDIADDLDTSRTVGWFTSVHPVVLDTEGAHGPGDALCAIKEQLRAEPASGMGPGMDPGIHWGLLRWLAPRSEAVDALRALPRAQVGFNFMGQFDRAVDGTALFRRAPESPGMGTSLRNRRHYLLDVGGAVTDGCLHVSWTWSTDVHERATIEALSERFLTALRQLITHCTAPGVGRRTPSDFPLACLNQAELSRLETRYGSLRIEDIYGLSPLQRGMVFHTLAEPDSPTYVTQLGLTLHGQLDVKRFRAAWQLTLDRNPILRTGFVVNGLREMHQVVCRDVSLRWSTEDWSDLPEQTRIERLQELAVEHRRQGFDLADPPLMRFALIRIDAERHRLIWTHHHILLDGWSLPLLVSDVFAAYRSDDTPAITAGPGERRPFSDYIRWIGKQDEERAAQHWRTVLADWSGSTPLPANQADASAVIAPIESDPATPAPRAIVGLDLSREASEALSRLARTHHFTLNTLVQGAWALLLSRHAARQDVVFGVTVSGRPPELPGVERMLGLFINTLPLRVDTSDAPLLEWLSSLQSQLIELQQQQASALYEVQQLGNARNQGPLFESLVVFENYPVEMSAPVRSSGIAIEDATDISHATFPLALVVQPRESLHLELRHDALRFDQDTTRQLLQHLATLLEAMGSRPEARLAQLPMLPDTERQAVFASLNPRGRGTDYPRDATVPEVFEQQARAAPDAMALDFGGTTLTYAQLDRQADHLAAALRAQGVQPGDLVALRVERDAGMVVCMLATLKAGAAYLPMDPADPERRAADMLEDSGARTLLAHATAADIPGYQGDVLDAEALLSAAAAGTPAPNGSEASAAPALRATDTAYVIYTSGSTGRPKGTVIPHRGITRLVLGTDYVSVLPSDRIAQAANPSFDAATFEIWGALLNGACVVGIDKDVALSPAALASTLRHERVSVIFVTTALFNQLVRHEPDIFAPLRYVLFGGEAVSPQTVRTVLRNGAPQHLLHMYGPTECTTYSTFHEVREVAEDAVTVPIGKPIAHSTAYVLDAHQQPVPAGAPGELYLGGDGLAREYHGRPELTAERFVPDPFGDEPGARLYRTGDLVRQDANGDLIFVGRLDHQVKLRGFRIEPGEIEAALLHQAAVKAAVVLCREDEPGDKRLVAYVVTQSDTEAEHESVRAELTEELPGFMIPSAWMWLPALPVNENGKVDRAALPAPDRQPTAAPVAPGNETERTIAAIWCDVLGLPEVSTRDNFFDLGGHSLKLLAVHVRLVEELDATLKVTDLFEHTTVEAQAAAIVAARGGSDGATDSLKSSLREAADAREAATQRDNAIAIVAMTGRFPGAEDVDTFWDNLCAGVESTRFFTDDELRAAGVSEQLLANKAYVRARAVLDHPDLFDARFFGYSPLEAELMDPQQRLFLETCHEALEAAAIDPDRYPGSIGVFAGASMNSYLDVLRTRPEVLARAGGLAAVMSAIHDFLTTRVSYQLNLRGPSVNVQSACSTSLVAVHEACRSLIEHRCDVALAGGVAVTVPWINGYIYEESGVRSSDGHCRTFDARADGMVSGNGVGVVVLKRLADAIADGDDITAVILGSAINNDGARKVGYTAPSIEGQAEVIAAAQAAAGIEPRSIGYVECHGTGTALGDPIEVAALTRVFRERTHDTGFCAVASLKSNMGHLDAAAGVAGLMKTALTVRHGALPASLHYERPNPEIDFDSSPFVVNTTCRNWIPEDGLPRRAGVSAFGIGGTNAHAVLEQPPVRRPSGPSRSWQLLQLSAKTPAALDRMTERLANHLEAHEGLNLADVAFSLRVGRRQFDHRRAVRCRTVAGALETLRGKDPGHRWTRQSKAGRPVVFLFPGQGAQTVDMGRDLYRNEAVFRDTVDACIAHLPDDFALELRDALYPSAETADGAPERLKRTALAQPALFLVEYALAKLWISWGVKPIATIGHSVGEYVSACLAGVLQPVDAIRLVAARGRLMDGMSEGVMLAVPLAEADIAQRLAGREGLWLAAINGPRRCVVSGTRQAVEALEAQLSEDGVRAKRLHTSHAFHSGMMEAAVAPFVDVLRQGARSAPTGIPYVSSLSGRWVSADDVADDAFWGRQIREPVRWADGLARILEHTDAVLLEVGPGRTLGSLARSHADHDPQRVVLQSLPEPGAVDDDIQFLLGTLGQLWTAGVTYSAERFGHGESRLRMALPTYPFDRERYWVERRSTQLAAAAGSVGRRPLDDWFYTRVWRPTRMPRGLPRETSTVRHALVFTDAGSVGEEVAAQLARDGIRTTRVQASDDYEAGAGAFTVRPDSLEDHQRLLSALAANGPLPDLMVHAWSADESVAEDTEQDLDRGFLSLMHLVRALCEAGVSQDIGLTVVTRGVHSVTGGETIRPARAAALGVVRTAELEQPGLHCRLVDLAFGEQQPATTDALVAELLSGADEPVVALREGARWVEAFAPVPVPATGAATVPEAASLPLRQGGVYLITGGLGGMGLTLAEDLVRRVDARLVLMGRTPLPERDQWTAHIAEHGEDDPVSRRLAAITRLEDAGAQVLAASGDICDATSVNALVAMARERFGGLDGVVHAAGVPPGGLLMTRTSTAARAVLAPKVQGTAVLLAAVASAEPDFVVLCSSLNVVRGFPGAADYAAANATLDAVARQAASPRGTSGSRTRVLSIAWNRWRESGMAVDAAGAPLAAEAGIGDAEGSEVFRRILSHDLGPNVLISEYPLNDFLRGTLPGAGTRAGTGAGSGAVSAGRGSASPGDAAQPGAADAPHAATSVNGGAAYPRPELGTEYVAPAPGTQQAVAGIWTELFGIAELGVHDDFFELGGHSLLATQLLGRLSKRFPAAGLNLRTLFDHPTIAAQATHIETTADGATDAPGADDGGTIKARHAAVDEKEVAGTGLDDLSDDEVEALLRRLTNEESSGS